MDRTVIRGDCDDLVENLLLIVLMQPRTSLHF